MNFKCNILFLCLFINGLSFAEELTLKGEFVPQDVSLQLAVEANVTLQITGSAQADVQLDFTFTNDGVLENIPSVLLNKSDIHNIIVILKPLSVGHTVLYVNGTPSNMTNFENAYAVVSVAHSETLDYVSEIVGWIYFLAWSISFYPQTIMNFRRKSVVGLHFDFLALNVVGFLYYSIFNIGLYWIPSIENQYFARHQFGVNPVQLNDVIFAIHAFFACLIQVSIFLF